MAAVAGCALSLSSGSAQAQHIVLSTKKAVRSTKNINIKSNKELVGWQNGGIASWPFQSKGSAKSPFVLLTYGAPTDLAFMFTLDGKEVAVEFKATDGFTEYRTAKIGESALAAGSHELMIECKQWGSFITLKQIEIIS